MHHFSYVSPPTNLDAIFRALADPTRRAILSRLVEGEASVSEIAAPLAISQPAVSRHLKVLERAGLIDRAIDEQRRPAKLRAEPMVAAIDWLNDFRPFWGTSFDQLDHVLASMKGAKKNGVVVMSELPEYKLDRIFNAPRELVWRAWTDPNILQRWYGPNVETIIHQFDLIPGGLWLNEMKMRGNSNFSKMIFQEVAPPTKLVWHHCSTDADWNISSNPMMPNWPRVLQTTVVFQVLGNKTNVRLTQVPLDATDAEIACFAKMMAGMDGGWGKGYAIVDELLVELQGDNK